MSEVKKYKRNNLKASIEAMVAVAASRKSDLDAVTAREFIAEHPWTEKFLSVGCGEADELWKIAHHPEMVIEEPEQSNSNHCFVWVKVPSIPSLKQLFHFKKLEEEELFISLCS